jgi:hypothetical protein
MKFYYIILYSGLFARAILLILTFKVKQTINNPNHTLFFHHNIVLFTSQLIKSNIKIWLDYLGHSILIKHLFYSNKIIPYTIKFNKFIEKLANFESLIKREMPENLKIIFQNPKNTFIYLIGIISIIVLKFSYFNSIILRVLAAFSYSFGTLLIIIDLHTYIKMKRDKQVPVFLFFHTLIFVNRMIFFWFLIS